MAKDPAMLWYWGDWHSGTVLLSRFLKGCYMDLLHAQFNNGPLSLEEIKTCLGSDFGQAWPTLQKKFKQADGLFFNEKLEHEKEKRKAFSESRKKNRTKKTYDTSYDKHMIPHMENENENTSVLPVLNVLKGENVIYTIEHCLEIAMNDERWRKSNKLLPGEPERFNHFLERQGIYQMNPMEYKRYFSNLKAKNPEAIKPQAEQMTVEELKEIARQMDQKFNVA